MLTGDRSAQVILSFCSLTGQGDCVLYHRRLTPTSPELFWKVCDTLDVRVLPRYVDLWLTKEDDRDHSSHQLQHALPAYVWANRLIS